MNIKDILEVEIISSGKDGEGVARLDNFVIFVPGTLIGEIVKIQIISLKKSFAQAKVIKILKASEKRIKPLCPIFFKCGGCDLQHIDYDYQLQIKKENIKQCIKKECGIEIPINDVVIGENKFGYRNKVQIPIRSINGVAKAGFYKTNSHIFVPFKKIENSKLGDCPLHTRKMQDIVDVVLMYINNYKISTYNELKNEGVIRHLVLRRIDSTYSICLVINSDKLPYYESLIENLKTLKINFSLYVSILKKCTNVIMGDNIKCLYGLDKTEGQALGIKYNVNPKSFLQINDEIRDKIYSKVVNIIKNINGANVIDVYSGIGIMSNVVAPFANKVLGIEIVKEAVDDANKLAILNNNNNIVNICGDAAIELPKVISQFKGKNSIVIIDPPRKGCDDRVIKSMLEAESEKIIYISCNPATLARDLNLLLSKYHIEDITPYDMFPQTSHIECLVTMSLKSR